MTMSLDGFVADPCGDVGRLYSNLMDLQGADYMNAAINETGAVLMGRKTFEMADPDSYVGTYEFQVPIFVLTHHPPPIPPRQDEHLTFTFVSEGVASAVVQAKVASGNKSVQVVGGANVIQQAAAAGLVDELHVDVMPVLLGAGLRFLEHLDPEDISLETIDVQSVGQRATSQIAATRRRLRCLDGPGRWR